MTTSLPALPALASDDVYGWLVGSWTLHPLHYAGLDVSSLDLEGEAHFHWALEGCAIQDVWIMPRRIGPGIVQIGARADGVPTRWRFTEIAPNSSHWIGESLTPDGVTWRLEGEFLATRIEEPRS